jgi:hypothetical protein
MMIGVFKTRVNELRQFLFDLFSMWQCYRIGKLRAPYEGAQFESFAKRSITDSIRIRKASY